MVLVSVENYIRPDTMNKKRYSDIGIYQGTWPDKMAFFNTSHNIAQSLLQYRNALLHMGKTIDISVGVDYSKLFYIDTVFIRYYVGSSKVDFLLNLKDSCNYKLLEMCLHNNSLALKKSFILLYEKFWMDAFKALALDSEWYDVLSEIIVW